MTGKDDRDTRLDYGISWRRWTLFEITIWSVLQELMCARNSCTSFFVLLSIIEAG